LFGRGRAAGLWQVGQGAEQFPDFVGMIGFPTNDVGFGLPGDLEQQISATEQEVNFRSVKGQLSLLSQDETILQGMSNSHGGIEVHYARGPFERVGRAHKFFQTFGCCPAPFEIEEPAGEDGDLVFGFDAEQLQHREIRQVIGVVLVHVRLRLRDEKTRSASSKPTDRPCHRRILRM